VPGGGPQRGAPHARSRRMTEILPTAWRGSKSAHRAAARRLTSGAIPVSMGNPPVRASHSTYRMNSVSSVDGLSLDGERRRGRGTDTVFLDPTAGVW